MNDLTYQAIDHKAETANNGAVNGLRCQHRQGHESDVGIMAHELTHVKQWWRLAGLFALLSVIAWQCGYGEAAFPLMVCGGFCS